MVTLILDEPLPRGLAQTFKSRIKQIALTAGIDKKLAVSVMITNDREIKRLNKEFRGINKTTDVLSFPAQIDEFPQIEKNKILGDIAISLPTAIKQAEKNNNLLIDELTLLYTHGLCHLLGFEHQTIEEETLMEEKVKLLVSSVGCNSSNNYGH